MQGNTITINIYTIIINIHITSSNLSQPS